ncbi:MAG: hypothetical protein ACE5GX_06810 [Thermoanaerobaculia bacterium]
MLHIPSSGILPETRFGRAGRATRTSRASRIAGFVLAVLAFALSPASADHSVFAFEARQWAAEPSGSFSFDAGPIGETLGLESDLGLQEDDALEGRLVFRPSRKTLIRIGYVPEIALEGDKVLTRTFTVLSQTFSVNERVVTAFDVEYGKIGFAWQFLASRDGRFRVGPLVEAKGFRADLGLSAPDVAPPVLETEKYEAGFVSAGLIADLEFSDRVELFGEATEVVSGDEGDVSETEIGIRYLPIPKVAVVGGLRTLEIEVKDTDQRFVFELDGVFLGIGVRF